ncbi:hypothetical protein NDU88_005429 [Pleurodeles waltl]|uniref:Uncharacterized protein n=1 Tax=Pleurodeles waltl TaxID=8319 RepID=A0AAV7NRH1_PLEWA|nr:hypothetical protein NDU88_005429 [Pleurodeles waltl]
MAAPSVFSRQVSVSEERMSGAHVKRDAPVSNMDDEVVVISDDEEEVQVSQGGALVQGEKGNLGPASQKGGRLMQLIPRVVSPMLHCVQSWEISNQAVLQLGEQIELVDTSGAVFKGTVCGERSSSGAMDRAYVSLDFWHPDGGKGPSGCDTSHASSGQGLQASHQRSGRMPVKVRVPLVHRKEGRVKPGAVYPTSGRRLESTKHSQPLALVLVWLLWRKIFLIMMTTLRNQSCHGSGSC